MKTPFVKSLFRHDLNLLRAVAVIAVVLFHFEVPGASGGFVGVDVFFVLSGYLMMNIILNQSENNKFNFFSFMEMRLRRIFPALMLVVVAVIFFEWFITPADTYLKHTRQALSALFFVSNIAFSGDNGYFAQAAQTKPLLHTWSLSIEWQFYIFLALFARFLNVRDKLKSDLFFLLVVMLILSVSICIYEALQELSSKAYFQLTSRSWEMLIGAVFAFLERNSAKKISDFHILHYWLRIVAWIVILVSCTFPWDEKMWPGFSTLIPTLATGILVVSANFDGLYFTRCVFKQISRMFYYIGLASYSIYLWHWPIYVIFSTYAKYHGIKASNGWKLILIALTLALSFLSYFFYEDPIRKNKLLWTSRRFLIIFGIGLIAIFIFVAFIFLNKGFIERLPSYAENAQKTLVTGLPRDECFKDLNGIDRLPDAHCLIGNKDRFSNHKFILLGDSLMHQFVNVINFSAEKYNLTGLVVTKSGCRMLAFPEKDAAALLPGCQKFDSENWHYLNHATDIQYVIVSGGYSNGKEIIEVIEKLSVQVGRKIIFIMPTIKIDFNVPEAWMLRQFQEDRFIDTWAISADEIVTRKSLFQQVEDYVRKVDPHGERIRLISPMNVICEKGDCFLVRRGQSNFRDQEHISNVNSDQYQNLFDDAFEWLSKNNQYN